jgi:alpha-amylase
VHKAANLAGPSMGYDPYDYYDLGEFDQKGSIPTWFGSRKELDDLIAAARAHGLGLIADMVINHNSGADGQELNPLTGESRWTQFRPGSGRFPRDWQCFHPNPYERWDEDRFGDMPDLSHRNPYVYGELLKLARWLVEEVGFDGFRYDFAKGYGGHTVQAIQEYRYVRDGAVVVPYGIAEHWSPASTIEQWADVTNFSIQNPVDAFDFPLREMLKSLCDRYGFSLRDLVHADTLLRRQPQTAVTFVENHDTRDQLAIVNDKMLAYSFILTHQGYPCVYWKDWFNYGLARPETPHGIAALIEAHRRGAGGGTQQLALDDDLYVMERTGWGEQPGLVYALNNRGDRWYGARVACRWLNTAFRPVAWWSASDLSRPEDKLTDEDGVAEFWAPPRGYVVYAPAS